MENKHFSHPHNLSLHEMPQGSKIDCSGCNLPCSGANFVCWQCKFFLHGQCFRASRSMNHPSHPLHPLTLIPYPTYTSGSFMCDSCGEIGSGFSFSCSSCDFDLHIHCACISNNTSTMDSVSQTEATWSKQVSSYAEQMIEHKSHSNHSLTLLSKPIYVGDEFICNACGEEGRESEYHCSDCNFDLHIECASLDETVNREDHEHPLTLYYSSPSPYDGEDMNFECDVCHCNVSKDCWIYCCLDCDYGTHVKCVLAKERSKQVVELEKIIATQQEVSKLQFQMQINRITAQMISSAINGARLR